MAMTREITSLTPEIIFDQLCNLGQIVFEVTDACNLKCSYCGYGDIYWGHDERKSKNLSFASAVALIDYMVDIWKNNPSRSANQLVYISFYGGEPLMNMPLVKQIVEYVEALPDLDRQFRFSMTTNAVLLNKYMDYLYEKQFQVLISLDGDEKGHSFRVDHSGRNSFKRVFENIRLLQKTYPEYFKKSVNFNSVIHERNSAEGVTAFIKEQFGKSPRVSSLSQSHITDGKREDFNRLYRNVMGSIRSQEEFEKLLEKSFMEIPIINRLVGSIFKDSGNVFNNYNELLYRKNPKIIPTGTCLPFERKIFLTVNDKVMVCERISQHFVAGQVMEGKVRIDLGDLAKTYNSYYEKLNKQCRVCSNLGRCKECVFHFEDLRAPQVSCPNFLSPKQLESEQNRMKVFLSQYPSLYKRIMDEVILS